MAKWDDDQDADKIWGRDISNRAQKEQLATKVAKRLKKGDVVGVGSGSTSFLVLRALASRRDQEELDFRAITTSIEMELICAALGITTTTLQAEVPDWSFDGADEVDDEENLIKGRGGALLREKLVIKACTESYIVIDPSKRVSRLGSKFPVPIETIPDAIHIVYQELSKMSVVESMVLRQAVAKDGPVITENGNVIFDVKFSKIDKDMESKLKAIVGVVETGLFIGYKPTIVSE